MRLALKKGDYWGEFMHCVLSGSLISHDKNNPLWPSLWALYYVDI